MSGRNIDRRDFVLCPQRDAHLFTSINEGRLASSFKSKLAMSAHQNALGAANGRPIEQQTNVTGDAEASRVRDSLPIQHQHIWLCFELLPGFEYGSASRKLSSPGDVGNFVSLRTPTDSMIRRSGKLR
jgi:hypothetical protein